MEMDFYQILGIPRSAKEDIIKKAFRTKASECHPDHGGDEQEFTKIQKIYEILMDEDKRSIYDATGHVDDNFNLRDEAEKYISGTFKALIDSGFNLNDDFLSRLFEIVTRELAIKKKNISKFESRCVILCKMRGRIKHKEGLGDDFYSGIKNGEVAKDAFAKILEQAQKVNIFNDGVKSLLVEAEAELAMSSKSALIMEEVFKVLNEYEDSGINGEAR